MSKNWKYFGVASLFCAFVAFQFINWKTTTPVSATRSPAGFAEAPEFKKNDQVDQINSLILGIQTPNDILKLTYDVLRRDAQINPVDGNKRTINNEGLRLYAIVATIIPSLEGGIYRLRTVIEKNMSTYIPSITALRRFKYSTSYLPKYYDAGFEYLTKPNPDKDILGQKGLFKDITALQVYLTTKFAPIIHNALSDLEILINNGKDDRIVYVTDLALSLGKSEAERIKGEHVNKDVSFDKIVLAGHLRKILAAGRESLGILYYVSSFNLEGASDFSGKVITQSYESSRSRFLTEIFGDRTSKNNIPSPKDLKSMFFEVRKSNPNFLKLNGNGAPSLSKSWAYFSQSAKDDLDYHRFIFELAGTLSSPDSYIVDADSLKAHEHEVMELVNKRKEIFSDKKTVIINSLSQYSFEVNVSRFFDPKVVADLSVFFPSKFYGDVADKNGNFPDGKNEVFGKGHEKFEWNYNYGKPVEWASPSFYGIFSYETKQSEVVKKVVGVMTYPPLNHLGTLLSLFI